MNMPTAGGIFPLAQIEDKIKRNSVVLTLHSAIMHNRSTTANFKCNYNLSQVNQITLQSSHKLQLYTLLLQIVNSNPQCNYTSLTISPSYMALFSQHHLSPAQIYMITSSRIQLSLCYIRLKRHTCLIFYFLSCCFGNHEVC